MSTSSALWMAADFNWGYYLESLRMLGETGIGKPFQAVQGPVVQMAFEE